MYHNSKNELNKRNRSYRTIFFLLIFVSLFVGCDEESSPNHINVEISNSELYQHPTVGGDEEGARIKIQAKYFEISEIIRNAETNYVATYTYKSKTDFIGRDFVEIEILTGSDGANAPINSEIIKIIFTISD